MGDKVFIALVVLVLILLVWVELSDSKRKEHADIAAPSFDAALVDKYRASIKNKSGMTLNDYALEAHMVSEVPLSGDYRVL